MNLKCAIILVNFGGPRNLKETTPFLKALLCDKDVVRTWFPQFLHTILFSRIATKRAVKVSLDYESIGGKSPIYDDTEMVATLLRKKLDEPIITFHRYLPATHPLFLEEMQNKISDQYLVFPMFPQFTYATTGSIARWFYKNLPASIVNKMKWIKSYPDHPLFIKAHIDLIVELLKENRLKEEETLLLFSAHGLPEKFIQEGDPYKDECHASFHAVMKAFPKAKGFLSFQSIFGKQVWIKPYTSTVCEDILSIAENKKNVVIVPISFTSDHIETLFEIEQEYLPLIRKRSLNAYRVPALTLREDWILAITSILKEQNLYSNQMLIRK